MKKIRNNNLVIAFVIALLFSIPLLTNSIPGFTVDFTYHLTRIEGIKSGLASHNFPIYIYPYANNGFGYASPLFYPDIFLLIPTFLYCLGIPIIVSYKIFIFIISFVTSYLSLLLFEHIFNNKFFSIISCFLYCFSDIRIALTYQASALGNVMGMMFIPMLFLSFYEYFIERKNNYLLIGVSFACMLLSHILSFTISVFMFVLFLIIEFFKNGIKKDRLICLIKSILLAMGLSAFFLFPMLEQMLSQKFWYQFLGGLTNKNMMDTNRYSMKDLFSCFALDLFYYGKSYSDHRYIGTILSIGSIFFYLIDKIKYKNRNIKNDLIMVVLLCGELVQLKYIPIVFLKPLYAMQFLWRLDAFLVPLAIYIMFSVISKMKIKRTLSNIILLLLFVNVFIEFNAIKMVGSGVYNNNTTYQETIELGYDPRLLSQTNNINLYELVNGEYLPYTNSYDYQNANANIEFANEETAVFNFERVGTTITFSTDYNFSDWIYMPLSWYKGYYYQELDDNGDVILENECVYNEYTKRVGLYMMEGNRMYRVYYKGTVIQKVSLAISTISFGLLCFVVYKRKIDND